MKASCSSHPTLPDSLNYQTAQSTGQPDYTLPDSQVYIADSLLYQTAHSSVGEGLKGNGKCSPQYIPVGCFYSHPISDIHPTYIISKLAQHILFNY